MLFIVSVALGAPLVPETSPAPEAQAALVPDAPKSSSDLDVVCVSFKEGLSEDWCYVACTDGVCPPDAAKDCMCGKGAPKAKQQQQASSQGKDWASGAEIPKEAVAVPLPSLAAPTDPTCVSIKTGTPDFWCQNTCGAQTNYCPEDTCNCGAGAVQESQAKAAAAMEDWKNAEREHRLQSGEGELPSPAVATQQAAAIPTAPGPATAQETAAAADAWAAAAANTAPEAVTAPPAAAAAAAAAAAPAAAVNGAGVSGPEATQPTEAWKAAAEAASKPAIAIPVADAQASPAPLAPPALTPEAQKILADRDAAMAARDAEIAKTRSEAPDDWTAAAKQAMDQVMADRDAEIAARSDGTSVPVGASTA